MPTWQFLQSMCNPWGSRRLTAAAAATAAAATAAAAACARVWPTLDRAHAIFVEAIDGLVVGDGGVTARTGGRRCGGVIAVCLCRYYS